MKTAHDLVLAARAGITELTPSQAQAWQAACGALLIDVREPDEFAAGHVPGAVNVPRGMLEFRIADLQPDGNAPVLVYCKTSGRAALAAVALQEMGYLNVKSIAGGFDAWAAAGKPVVKPEVPTFG